MLNDGYSVTTVTYTTVFKPQKCFIHVQDRYIGDAIELGYTIKTTGADDSIVHIVQ